MESTSGENNPHASFADRLRAALALELPYTERLLKGPLAGGAQAAVLVVFGFVDPSTSPRIEESSLLVIRRAESQDAHSGQMAFPGGRAEPDEVSRGAFFETALRETEEEVGISRADVEIVGNLPLLTTGTGFRVEPFVAVLKKPMGEISLQIDSREIAEALWVPWKTLIDPAVYRREWVERGPIRFPTHVFYVGPHRIWGATGAMIKNLIDRWR